MSTTDDTLAATAELMAPLSDADLSALHRQHAFGTEGTCDGCREPFPCRTLRLVSQAMVARLTRP